MHTAVLLVAVTSYLIAAYLVLQRISHKQGPKHPLLMPFGVLAVLGHLILLNQGVIETGGQNLSMANVASLIAWLISLGMTLASFSLANVLLLPVVYGFAAFIILLNALMPDSYLIHIGIRPGLLVHITLALFAYGVLVIALLYALQLGYISDRLKHKQVSPTQGLLPPLMKVEVILFKLLFAGTMLLGLSLISGWLFLDDMLAHSQAHKTVLSLIAFTIFSVLLLGHKVQGWRGKVILLGTVLGTTLLTLAYFGSRFVREIILG